ncbi:YceI family protein [Pseudonocardia sp. RS11V-5]|uniref:YceI family protein n=1 Tax=Pseudonocardia terrae TaxID=2905831 RepID=UPI001E5383F8|nr:YceI family protein [Pseudonocardia terrae]MCE3551774.1 YceI family protein [Pseudonocardia terrae]
MKLRTYWKRYLLGAVVLVVVSAVGGPLFYAKVIEGDAAAPLAVATDQTAATGELGGDYTVSSGSESGYRVHEILGGQSIDAVGRTQDVSGSATVSGSQVTAGDVTVQLASVKSDQDRRDDQFTGNIMNVAEYPTATFRLTDPLDLGAGFTGGDRATANATGELTVRDVTRPVTFPMTAVRNGTGIDVSGSVPVTFADFGVTPPSIGDFVKVDPTGQIEFLLKLARAA